ncbi:MAG: caspase family protein [Mesorhizobium sp.]|nr:caspase family protein [Mesorhizobium sp.]
MRKTGWAYLLAIACLAGSLPAIAPAAAGSRVALVIGNAAYDNLSPLGNPVADASRMADMLAANGFDVMSCDGARRGCFDLSRSDLLDALDEFRDKAEGADLALAFYAGHGMQTDSGNVIAPTDIELDCADWKAKRAVLLDDVLEAMDGAKEKIVILDACRNDPFRARQCVNRGVRPLSFGSFAVPQSTSRFLLVSSTQNGQVAQDGLPGAHSPFAESLFSAMEAQPAIAFDQLFNKVAKNVIEKTASRNFTQVPEMLVRGGAPETCLAGSGCGMDPYATALRAEIETLKAQTVRNQQYEDIVVALLRSGGLDPKTVGAEQKEQFFRTVMAAARALEAKGAEGQMALAAMARGQSTEAENIFAREAAAPMNNPNVPPGDIARSSRNLAALARVQGRIDEALRLYRQATMYLTDDPALWIDYAETAMAFGDYDLARAAYEAGMRASGKGPPADQVWLTEGHADTFWSTDPDMALAGYLEANQLARRLLVGHPDDSGLKRGLIVTHYNMGHIAMDRGQTDVALAEFRKGLAIAEELASADRSDARWQYDIGRGHERIGRALEAAGDLAGAQQAYLRKQAIASRLADATQEATYIRDAALAEEFLAGIARRQGDLATAELRYEGSVARMASLRAAAPDNPDFQRFASVTLLALGDLRVEFGKADAAWPNYLEAAALSERLVALNPRNGQWGWDLFRAYQRLASTRPPGVEYHTKALALIERLKADGLLEPGNEKWIAITRKRLEMAQGMPAEGAPARN